MSDPTQLGIHLSDTTPRERLGNFLRAHREGLGLTQDELAERLGVTQATISRYEKGKSFDGNPSHAYGMKEHYRAAPLDPVARRDYFNARNPQMPSLDGALRPKTP